MPNSYRTCIDMVRTFISTPVLTLIRVKGSTDAVLRMAKMKAGPIVTDNGNFCIDAPFGEEYMRNPHDVRPLILKQINILLTM